MKEDAAGTSRARSGRRPPRGGSSKSRRYGGTNDRTYTASRGARTIVAEYRCVVRNHSLAVRRQLLSKAIKTLRERVRWTQHQLAAALSKHLGKRRTTRQTTISKWEHGVQAPSAAYRIALAQIAASRAHEDLAALFRSSDTTQKGDPIHCSAEIRTDPPASLLSMNLHPQIFIPSRVYGPEYSLEDVARRLRREADRGFLRGVDFREDTWYRKRCSGHHILSRCAVVLTRDDVPGDPPGYHASICFVGEHTYEPWNEDRPRVKPYGAATVGVRHFLLEAERW
jgi:transcriptional regulator with XRE-family HTH domain